MKTLKPILLLALVFIAGAGSGVVGSRVMFRRVVTQAIEQPDRVRDRIERQMVRRLDLNADQRVKVRAILAETHKEIRALRAEFQPRYAAIMDETQEKISTVLTPEQREKLRKLRGENRPLRPRP